MNSVHKNNFLVAQCRKYERAIPPGKAVVRIGSRATAVSVSGVYGGGGAGMGVSHEDTKHQEPRTENLRRSSWLGALG